MNQQILDAINETNKLLQQMIGVRPSGGGGGGGGGASAGGAGGGSLAGVMGQLKALPILAAAAIQQIAGDIMKVFGTFVQAFDPAAVMLFSMAVKDMNAAIGRILLPIFNQLTGVMRFLGDTIAAISEPLMQFVQMGLQAFIPYLEALEAAFQGVLVDIIPSLTSYMKQLFDVLGDMWKVSAQLIGPLMKVISAIMKVGYVVDEAIMGILKSLMPFWQIMGSMLEIGLSLLAPIIDMIGLLIKIGLIPLQLALAVLMVPFQLFAELLKPIATMVNMITTAFSEVIDMISTTISDVMKVVLDSIRSFVDIGPLLGQITAFITQFAAALKAVVDKIREYVNRARSLVGLKPLATTSSLSGSAAGLGAGSVGTSNVSSYLTKLQTNSYMNGSPTEQAAIKAAKALEEMNERDKKRDSQEQSQEGRSTLGRVAGAVAFGPLSLLW